jgi:hypothetical protein
VPRNVSSSIAATRACATPTREAIRGLSWFPRTQFGHAPAGKAASYVRTTVASAAKVRSVIRHQAFERQVNLADQNAALVFVEHRPHFGNDRVYFGPVRGVERNEPVVGTACPHVGRIRRVVAETVVLNEHPEDVDTKPVDAALEPKAHRRIHRRAHRRIAPVQVRLFF